MDIVQQTGMMELRFKHDGGSAESQGSRLGFNVCVAPSSVKLGVLEFTERTELVRSQDGVRIRES